MTFSIAARCARTGRFGIAVASSSPAVAARCAHVRAGVGAVCSQNVTDPRLGPAVLDRLARGEAAPVALDALVNGEHMAFRQLLAVDVQGRTAVFSGSPTLGLHAEARGTNCVAAGNMLADPAVPTAMVATFDKGEGALAARLLAALAAGLAAGGEAGPVRSAGLAVVAAVPWPETDLRVDWDNEPIARLASLWSIWEPQADTYVTRALDPAGASSFGVPGDP